MDQEGGGEASIDFVPALCFVPRGVAKERPERVVLTQSQLARIIQETRDDLPDDIDDDEDDSNEDDGNEMEIDGTDQANRNPGNEFDFGNYDDEGATNAVDINAIVEPNEQIPDEENDSEAEDEIIKPTDNLILVGHVQDDAASMEVWVFNEEEESLYTHHDFILPSFPLCIEWLNHDPGSDKQGNMCAIGCIDPVITVWDLDIQDSIVPAFKLGSKGNRKKRKEAFGHTDAVLDLSWNHHFEHILASSSVDQKIILWDLDEGEPHTTIKTFKEKVQSLRFHPDEAQSILTGGADGYVRLFDCRNADTVDSNYVQWKIDGEVEKVLWNPCDTNHFIIGTNDGSLHYADRRQPKELLWSVKGHAEEISGICFNKQVPNLMTSTSTDGMLKVWNFNASSMKEVYSHDFQMGRLQCMKQSPEDPFTVALGGEKAPRCRIYNIKNFEAVRKVFKIAEVLQ